MVFLIILLVILLVFFLFFLKKQKVGFIDDRLYYAMSYADVKDIFGNPNEDYAEYDGHKYCIYNNIKCSDIEGKVSFDFYKNHLTNVNFSGNKCTIETAKEIAEKIKSLYVNKKGFYENVEKDDETEYKTLFGVTNGATGVKVSLEFKYGGIDILGTLYE